MSGSKVKIWKQDPSVRAVGIRTEFIDSKVSAGPRDKKIAIATRKKWYPSGANKTFPIPGMPRVKSDSNGDFIFDPKDDQQFDAVHTFSIVRLVLRMYERTLKRMNITDDFKWQWGDAPIRLHPHAGNWQNAFYKREWKALCFFYTAPVKGDGAIVYSCRSLDVVAHETGHAILDSLKPDWLLTRRSENGALHEAFGDLTAIFLLLNSMDTCAAIIAESKGNLNQRFFFTVIAEEFGVALGRQYGLRNADNDLTMSGAGREYHMLSRVLTGAVYHILAEMFEQYRKTDKFDQSETLYRVGKHIISLVLLAFIRSQDSDEASFKDVANNMIKYETKTAWKEIIRKEFQKREILGPNAKNFNDVPAGATGWGIVGSVASDRAPCGSQPGTLLPDRLLVPREQKPKRSGRRKMAKEAEEEFTDSDSDSE